MSAIRRRLNALENRIAADCGGLDYPHLSREELDAEAERLRAEGRTIILAPNAPPGMPQIIEICDGGLLPGH